MCVVRVLGHVLLGALTRKVLWSGMPKHLARVVSPRFSVFGSGLVYNDS